MKTIFYKTPERLQAKCNPLPNSVYRYNSQGLALWVRGEWMPSACTPAEVRECSEVIPAPKSEVDHRFGYAYETLKDNNGHAYA